ncbi:hypothetical protein [Brachybacterium sp. p3-SID957]|uniref:hypothetical protein n=1 Tax=Brachybacterium sp. p3-SID957 TaxID=2916049 RepID=UPI00223BD16E|nr:hypothetical protein [Brachybacterium sp. p3-SID957]MCT1776712.1 hypothetical protein [Brachybacterium sp. p3-SID957]
MSAVRCIEEALARAGIDQRPVAMLDLDAFGANAEDLATRAGASREQGLPIRVASTSLRMRGLLERVLERPGFAGVLAYTLREAMWLSSCGIEDLVVAYPTADREAIASLARDDRAARSHITLMVDETAQLDLILDATRGLIGPGRPVRTACC